MLDNHFTTVLSKVEHLVTRLNPLAALADGFLALVVPKSNAFAFCYEKRTCFGCNVRDWRCAEGCSKRCTYRWCCDTGSGVECGPFYGDDSFCCLGCFVPAGTTPL